MTGPIAEPTAGPNVVFIMSDQQKATASHLYGSSFCQTPSMERLAREGVLFEHCVTPHPLCMPARISVWASQYPHTHGGRRNETPMPAHTTHAFQLWHDAGYQTGLIGKNHCFERPEDQQHFDTWLEIGHLGLPAVDSSRGMEWFRPLEGVHAAHVHRRDMKLRNPRFSYEVSSFPLEDYSTGLVAGQTVQFLEKHQHDPFALWVSFPDPHTPWEIHEHYADMFPPDKIDMPPWRDGEFDGDEVPERNKVLYEMLGIREDDPEDVRRLVGIYHAMTRFVDDGVGQILDALDDLGLRDDTIVVFCSDHGDFIGEHAMQSKGGVFYDCLTRVPLVLSWPGHVPAPAVDDSMVNLIDIVPTLLQLQGLPVPASMQGQPLPTVTNSPPRDAAFSEYGAGGPAFGLADLAQLSRPWGFDTLLESLRWREAEGRRKMVRTRDWKYVHDPMGDLDELYDLRADPWELTNLAAQTGQQDVVADMQLRLAGWSIETEDSRPVPLP